MKLKVFLFLAAAPLLVSGWATHCDVRTGPKEYRCAKDNYKEDSVHIVGRSNEVVSFNIRKYTSAGNCNIMYSEESYSLVGGEGMNVQFSAALEGVVQEMFVRDCVVYGQPLDCQAALIVNPNVSTLC